MIYPNVAKAGGLQSQGVKGEVVVVYLESLTTQDLKFSGFPDGPQSGARRGNIRVYALPANTSASSGTSVITLCLGGCDFWVIRLTATMTTNDTTGGISVSRPASASGMV
jgi:hypothetical protein